MGWCLFSGRGGQTSHTFQQLLSRELISWQLDPFPLSVQCGVQVQLVIAGSQYQPISPLPLRGDSFHCYNTAPQGGRTTRYTQPTLPCWHLATVTSHERHAISNYRLLHCLFNSLFRLTTKQINTKVPHNWPLSRESTSHWWIPSTRASIAESVAMSWRHHELGALPNTCKGPKIRFP